MLTRLFARHSFATGLLLIATLSIVRQASALPCPPTAEPTANGPSGTISNPMPPFTWSAVPGATSYTLYVLEDHRQPGLPPSPR